ncbi:MAG: acyltransferase family protein [Anaerovoracaceae bacterium]|jgi:fucose 4-O-acetylase-like acetyltransferase
MKTETLQKVRSPYWDNLKFFLITLVVVGHFVAPYAHHQYFWPRYVFMVIYTFHMPMFIFVSGMFSKSAINGRRFKLERMFSFILLYVAYKVIKYFLLNYALDISVGFHLFVVDDLPWYMLCMAAWLGSTYLVRNVNPVWMMIIAIAMSFFIGFDDKVGDVFALARMVNYWPFFLLGYYFDRDRTLEVINKPAVRIVGIAIFLALLIVAWAKLDQYASLGQLFTGRNSYASISSVCEPFKPWFRLVYFPYIAFIGLGVMSIIPRRKLLLISDFGSRTLAVYFLHRFVLYIIAYFGFYTAVQTMFPEEKYWTLILIACGVITTFVLSLKVFSYPFDWVMKQKYRFMIKDR